MACSAQAVLLDVPTHLTPADARLDLDYSAAGSYPTFSLPSYLLNAVL